MFSYVCSICPNHTVFDLYSQFAQKPLLLLTTLQFLYIFKFLRSILSTLLHSLYLWFWNFPTLTVSDDRIVGCHRSYPAIDGWWRHALPPTSDPSVPRPTRFSRSRFDVDDECSQRDSWYVTSAELQCVRVRSLTECCPHLPLYQPPLFSWPPPHPFLHV